MASTVADNGLTNFLMAWLEEKREGEEREREREKERERED